MAKITPLNIKNHILIPKHSVLSEKEAESLVKKFDVNPANLPRILKNDPVLEGIKVKEGNIIKIERDSPIAGRIEFYRRVSNE